MNTIDKQYIWSLHSTINKKKFKDNCSASSAIAQVGISVGWMSDF